MLIGSIVITAAFLVTSLVLAAVDCKKHESCEPAKKEQ